MVSHLASGVYRSLRDSCLKIRYRIECSTQVLSKGSKKGSDPGQTQNFQLGVSFQQPRESLLAWLALIFYPEIHLPKANPQRKQTCNVKKVISMKQWFSSTSDRYGHLITDVGRPASQLNGLFHVPKAKQIGRIPEVAQSATKNFNNPSLYQSLLPNTKELSPIRRILIPVDGQHTRAAELKPFLELARRFDAEVTLLHCYTTPPSFDYAVGPSALLEVNLHRNIVRARLLKLCSEVQKFFAKCHCQFTFGSLPAEILRASERLQADMIAIPLSLDFVSHCWTTKDLLDELVRQAHCPVLGVPSPRASSRSLERGAAT